ncbi:hypothetical protein B0H14DRAFT_3009261 [Mycena olivaceomarginata]|nr:hypothetical protein B0H14DRAFT_3009261 [Mycena olivaceomarginata]
MTLIPHLEPESTRTLLPEPATAEHIHELLRSNAEAPDDLPAILSVLADELVRYDEQIARLKARLTRTESDRSKLKAHYDSCRGLLAPVRRLPPELFVKIFALCRATTPVLPPNFYSNLLGRLAHQNLLTISQVCARWRDLALGTSTLWDTITLHEELWSGDRDQVKKVLVFLNLALERGGRSLLKLEASGNMPELALRLLATHSERWRAAEFSCDVSNFHYLAGAKGKLPFSAFDYLGSAHPRNGQTTPPPTTLLHCYRHKAGGSPYGTVLGVGSITSNTFGAGNQSQPLDCGSLPCYCPGYAVNDIRYPIPFINSLRCDVSRPYITPSSAIDTVDTPCPISRVPPSMATRGVPCIFHALLVPYSLKGARRMFVASATFTSTQHFGSPTKPNPDRRFYVSHPSASFSCLPLLTAVRRCGYLKFLLSRSEKGCTFESKLFWFPRHGRELCPDVTAQIQELRSQRQLAFSFDEWDYEA